MTLRTEPPATPGPWARLAAPVAGDTIAWRQDGAPVLRDGRHYARFVAYIEANTVRERLDLVVPGEWDLTLELLPPLPSVDDDAPACSFKARLQILGVIREDVGTGRDYKAAATDAFKRAAVRFGIGHELYAYEQNWVAVDGPSRHAKPIEDPQAAYDRRYGSARPPATDGDADHSTSRSHATERSAAETTPPCPNCGGLMWDNRATKRNPRAPDYRCRTRSCAGVIWPTTTRSGAQDADVGVVDDNSGGSDESELVGASPTTRGRSGEDDLPF